MGVEKAQSIIAPLYHNIYDFMQDHKLFGAWQRTARQHVKAINEHLGMKKNLSILYCGTATTKNPQDVYNLIQEGFDIRSSITTLDLSNKPLSKLDCDIYQPVQADSASLPYASRSFDYITTDFLLSKMTITAIISTIQEWGRCLKNGGLITTTIGVKQPHTSPANHLYDKITDRLYGIHFLPKELLRQIFHSAGLEVKFEQAQFDTKPFMYHYPDDLLVFAEAKLAQPKDSEMMEKAKTLITDSLFIHAATRSELHLRPLGFEEILMGIIHENFIVMRQENGQMFGFIRVRKLAEDWFEIGSLYISPLYRNTSCHYGSNLLLQAVNAVKQRRGKAIVFSDNQTVIRTLKNIGAEKQQLLPLKLTLPLMRDRIGNRETSKDFMINLLNKKGRSIYTLSFS